MAKDQIDKKRLNKMARKLRPFLARGVVISADKNLVAGGDLILTLGEHKVNFSAVGDDMTYLAVVIDGEDVT